MGSEAEQDDNCILLGTLGDLIVLNQCPNYIPAAWKDIQGLCGILNALAVLYLLTNEFSSGMS